MNGKRGGAVASQHIAKPSRRSHPRTRILALWVVAGLVLATTPPSADAAGSGREGAGLFVTDLTFVSSNLI